MATFTPNNGWSFAATGDFNGDGTTDVLFKYTNGALYDWQVSNGVYSSGHSVGVVPSGFSIVGTGDFNGDGTTDILIQNTTTEQVEALIVRNNAVTSTSVIGTPSPTGMWKLFDTGDFNGDGQTDVLFRNSNSGAMLDWIVSNGKTITQNSISSPGVGWTYVANGDVNGDGTSDLIFEYSNGALSDWQMANGKVVSSHSLGKAVPSGFTVVGTGDFTGNGISDVLIENASTGQAEVGIVSGGTIAKWSGIGTAAPSGGWHFTA
jgi:hypothetical protein